MSADDDAFTVLLARSAQRLDDAGLWTDERVERYEQLKQDVRSAWAHLNMALTTVKQRPGDVKAMRRLVDARRDQLRVTADLLEVCGASVAAAGYRRVAARQPASLMGTVQYLDEVEKEIRVIDSAPD